MSFLARILTSFDEALDWPDDLFLGDDHVVEDGLGWPTPTTTTSPTAHTIL